MEALLDVISVKTRDDYSLELVFENGEKRIFDMKPFLDKRADREKLDRDISGKVALN